MSTLTANLFSGSINKAQGDTLQICIVQIIRPIIRVRMIQLAIYIQCRHKSAAEGRHDRVASHGHHCTVAYINLYPEEDDLKGVIYKFLPAEIYG